MAVCGSLTIVVPQPPDAFFTVSLTALQFISPSATLLNHNPHIFFVPFCLQQFPTQPLLFTPWLHPLILSVEGNPCI